MFSTSTGSSPQTAPTTPDSSSNTGSDDYSSQHHDHGHDLWGYPLASGIATMNASSNGNMTSEMDDIDMSMMGLGYDQAFDGGQGATSGGGGGGMEHCPIPLQDLIHESLISNSPVASTTGIIAPNLFPMAWFNRSTTTTNNNNANAHPPSSLPPGNLPSTPLNSPAPGISMGPSSPPPSIDTAFFNLARQYPDQNQTFQQQQLAFPPDAFVVQNQSSRRHPNGHSCSTSTSTSHLKSQRNSPPIKVKSEKLSGPTTASAAGLFSRGTGSMSSSWQLRATNVPKKSRIETQVKLGLDLIDVSGSLNAGPGVNPDTQLNSESGEPVTDYNFIRVPKTASVKTKSRGVCDPDPSKVLTLTATIYCAKDSLNPVPAPCCADCQRRERKRNNKKAATTSSSKASRSASASKNPTPATSDVEAYASHNGQQWSQGAPSKEDNDSDDYVSPIDFTCAPMLDFSSGSAPLSFRIVCYCRHHKEKNGFCIILTLKDNFGRTVGEVTTPPIMITDDHKSVPKLTPAHTADEEDGDSYGISTKRRAKRVLAKYSEGESRMRQEDDEADDVGVGAIRNKHRPNRKTNTLSRSAAGISKLSSTSTGSNLGEAPITTTTNIYNRVEPPSNGHRSSHSYATHSESPLATTAPSSPSAGFSPPPGGGGVGTSENPNLYMGDMDGVMNSLASLPLLSPASSTFQPPVDPGVTMRGLMNNHMSGLSVTAQAPLPPLPNPYPVITRVIPGSGPMLGGIEVTLLGSNFSRELLANSFIVFGSNYVPFSCSDNTMTMVDGGNVVPGAQVWSETVIICTLPPSVVAGPVEVKLLGAPVPQNQMDMDPTQGGPSPPIFVYTDENERDLMITALQMLGYQNSGQWQDARSVAMHILGNQNQGMGGMSGVDDLSNTNISSILGGPYNFSTAISGGGSAPRAPSRVSSQQSKKVEDAVLRVLRSAQHPVTGVISQISTPHPVTGQTLLHFASALGLSKLVWALIGWKANVLTPDKNGFSPVHFACFYGRTECVEILVRVGRAHLEGRDVTGRTPLDVCGTDEVRELVLELEEEVETRKRKSRIGSEVESGGEGDDEGLSWSEADDDDDDEDQRPNKIPGAKAPQSVSRRISRVNSMVSIASHKGISRAGTPYLVDDILAPMTPMRPTPAQDLVPPSPTSSWVIGRNIAMPWSAGWQLPQLPNVSAMPQFVQRRGDARQRKRVEGDSQKEKEQMFKWMMWMDTARKMWQAQQQQQTTEPDIDPPPSYSPTGTAPTPIPPQEKAISGTIGVPAVPTALDEPPSPLSLDSPYRASTTLAGPSESQIHHRNCQRQPSYPQHGSNEVSSVSAVQPTQAVVQRKTKTRDTMLIYFWIPVLLLAITWATYKSFAALHRILLPDTPTAIPARVAIEL